LPRTSAGVLVVLLMVAAAVLLVISPPAAAKRKDRIPPTFAGLKSATRGAGVQPLFREPELRWSSSSRKERSSA
jgi:hypothetical protein